MSPPEHLAAPHTRRLFVTDHHTGRRFLVDSGAEISLLPDFSSKFKNQINFSLSTLNLIATNGSKIKTYGPKLLQRDLWLKRVFTWSFELADVGRPILGADFLHYYGLLVDIRRSRLVDTSHRFSVQAALAPDAAPAVIYADRFQKYGIAINPVKCVFATSVMSFLGHIVDKDACRPNAERVAAIREWTLPQTKKQLQRFLGSLKFYHRFIPNAAATQAPLYDMTSAIKKQDGQLDWLAETRECFDDCRQALADTAQLAHPQPNATLRLNTDASNIAVGVVLEQKVSDQWQPLGFFL